MSKVVKGIAAIGFIALGVLTGGVAFLPGTALAFTIGASTFLTVGLGLAVSLIAPALQRRPDRAAAAATLQLGEVPRSALVGRAATAGSLVDAFNYGGKDKTDWEVLVIALADHRCEELEGFFVNDTYHPFTGDGTVTGFNNQFQVFFRPGTWDQSVPSILTTNGPGWTANDRGRGVCYVVAAYKADDADAKNPVWPAGRPRFTWVLKGLRCYQARKDTSIGGSGAHRRDNAATWEWTQNPIDIRYNWVRGIYAGDRTDQPEMLLIGRGLSEIEAPPQNVFARANLCDEVVGTKPRYRIGGSIFANEAFIEVENDIAAACGGIIVQREGSVEIDPGEAKAASFHFTDADLLTGSKVTWSEFLGSGDEGWVNTVVARFTDPDQQWTERAAPVRRDVADIAADRGPRELEIRLGLVTDGDQAQRVAEIQRRFGRLWKRATVTLPPQFADVEEGDWGTWQSDRYFDGATLTFRVEAYGSSEAWHHQLTLRQISASVYSDTDPLDDGAVAVQQEPPGALEGPGAAAWAVAAIALDGGDVLIPALLITGAVDDPRAQFIRFEYVQSAAAPDAATVWTDAGSVRPDATRFEIPVTPNAQFYAAVSYVIDGITAPRRVLGPVTTPGFGTVSFDPIAPVAIQADQAGVTTTILPVSRQVRLLRGGTLQTSGVSVGTLIVPGGIAASASVSGGIVTVTISQADAAGTIIVPVTFAGVTYTREIVVNRNRSGGQQGGGAGSSLFTDETLSTVSTTTYERVSDAGILVSADASGELRFRASGQYDGDGTMEIIARYSSDGGTTWIDAGASAVGSAAQSGWTDPFEPEPDTPGFVNLDRTVTGLVASADYTVALFARRTSGSGNLSWVFPNFTVSHP